MRELKNSRPRRRPASSLTMNPTRSAGTALPPPVDRLLDALVERLLLELHEMNFVATDDMAPSENDKR